MSVTVPYASIPDTHAQYSLDCMLMLVSGHWVPINLLRRVIDAQKLNKIEKDTSIFNFQESPNK